MHLPHEMIWNASLMRQANFIEIFLAWHVSGTYAHHQEHQTLSCSVWSSAPSFWMGGGSWELLRRSCVRCGWRRAAPFAPYTQPTQRLSRPPPIQKLGAENRTLQLNVWCSWWWAYVPETCHAKNISIKLPCRINVALTFWRPMTTVVVVPHR